MLQAFFEAGVVEAGCDEAGRGCLAGPVFAAAVILPAGFRHGLLNDSKRLSEKERYKARDIILEVATAWAVGQAMPAEIDRINILNASIMAMHRAIDQLAVRPESLLIDGNHFRPYKDLPSHCIIKGDSRLLPIAAASILAKTCRDDHMLQLAREYPQYEWHKNKGYPTLAHRRAIGKYGPCLHHRRSFRLSGDPPQGKRL